MINLLFIWFSIGVAIAAIEKGKWIPNAGAIGRALVLGIFSITVLIYAIKHGIHGFGFKDFVLRKGMLYDGSHLRLPNTTALRGTVIEAEPLDGVPVLLDVDGEQPGRLPARFTILPGALRARMPRIDA